MDDHGYITAASSNLTAVIVCLLDGLDLDGARACAAVVVLPPGAARWNSAVDARAAGRCMRWMAGSPDPSAALARSLAALRLDRAASRRSVAQWLQARDVRLAALPCLGPRHGTVVRGTCQEHSVPCCNRCEREPGDASLHRAAVYTRGDARVRAALRIRIVSRRDSRYCWWRRRSSVACCSQLCSAAGRRPPSPRGLSCAAALLWMSLTTQSDRLLMDDGASVRPLAEIIQATAGADGAQILAVSTRAHSLEFYLQRLVSRTENQSDLVLPLSEEQSSRVIRSVKDYVRPLAAVPAIGIVGTKEAVADGHSPTGVFWGVRDDSSWLRTKLFSERTFART